MGLKYYDDKKYEPLSTLLRQCSIKTENKLLEFSDSSWKYCPDTERSTGVYIIFHEGRPIDHGAHVPGTVSKSSAEIEYNATCTAVMELAHFRMLIPALLNKDTDIVPEEAPLIILNIKSAVCMDKNGKDINHKRNISRRVHLVRNGEKCKNSQD